MQRIIQKVTVLSTFSFSFLLFFILNNDVFGRDFLKLFTTYGNLMIFN